MNSFALNDVSMQLNIANFSYQLQPKQEELLSMILKQGKESVKERCLNVNTIPFTKISESVSDLRIYFLRSACSFVKIFQNLKKN